MHRTLHFLKLLEVLDDDGILLPAEQQAQQPEIAACELVLQLDPPVEGTSVAV